MTPWIMERLSDVSRNWIEARFLEADRRLEASGATAPVPGGLSDTEAASLHPDSRLFRPIDTLTGLYALHHRGLDLDDLTVAWIGRATAGLHGWLEAAALFTFRLRLAFPDGLEPDPTVFLSADREAAGRIQRFKDPRAAASGGQVLVTDRWESEEELGRRFYARLDQGYRITLDLMEAAGPEVVVMHDSPARAGRELDPAVWLDPRCLVDRQRELRPVIESVVTDAQRRETERPRVDFSRLGL